MSSYQETFCKNGVVRNFTKFTGNHLHQSRFFNRVAGLRPNVYSCEFCETSKNTFTNRASLVTASKNSLNIAVISFERGFSVHFVEAMINVDPSGLLCILEKYIKDDIFILLLGSEAAVQRCS